MKKRGGIWHGTFTKAVVGRGLVDRQDLVAPRRGRCDCGGGALAHRLEPLVARQHLDLARPRRRRSARSSAGSRLRASPDRPRRGRRDRSGRRPDRLVVGHDRLPRARHRDAASARTSSRILRTSLDPMRAMSSWYFSSTPSVSATSDGSSATASSSTSACAQSSVSATPGALNSSRRADRLHEGDDLARQPLAARPARGDARIASSRAASG